MKILIAEDDATSRLALKRTLQKWGYEVVVTRDGHEAWEAIQRADGLALAILDWMMPGMDGVEVCRRVRASIQTPMYLIVLTAKNQRDDIVAALEHGADDHIAKPFDSGELRARVDVGRRVVELQTALAQRVEELQQALAQITTLEGLLPICMYCHKIRNDGEVWQKLEAYISEHSDATFSHGLCPECFEKHFGEYASTENRTGLEGAPAKEG